MQCAALHLQHLHAFLQGRDLLRALIAVGFHLWCEFLSEFVFQLVEQRLERVLVGCEEGLQGFGLFL